MMKYKLFCAINSITSLVLGVSIYLFLRKDTYLHIWVNRFAPLHDGSCFSFFGADFLRYYFPDYLWGYSLCFALCCFIPPKKGRLEYPAVITALLGCGLELLQAFGWIRGTGDVLDGLMYLTAGLTVAVINKMKTR